MIPDTEETRFREVLGEYTRTLDCVHCGLCIPECPTYTRSRRESDSPRGRIYLMRHHAEGRFPMTQDAKRHLDECIVCRACETACPSGINMAEMMESFRGAAQIKSPNTSIKARLGRMLLRRLLPYRGRVRWATHLVYLQQVLGIDRLVAFLNRRLLRSPKLDYLLRLQPPIASPSARRVETTRTRADGYPARGKPRMRVGLFLGCITSEWFAHVHQATIRVLQENGCHVIVPDAQTCCGALHRHSGLVEETGELFAHNTRAFKDAGVDVIVVNAAGCGASLKEPPDDKVEATGLSAPVRDVCEFLDEVGIVPPRASLQLRVAYDQPCHLLHAQRVGADVVEGLLQSIPDLRIVPLRDSERCCGSGGVYNLLHPEIGASLAAEKAAAIRESNPDVVVTGNPGCALQIRAALATKEIEVLHPVELLDRAYSNAEA